MTPRSFLRAITLTSIVLCCLATATAVHQIATTTLHQTSSVQDPNQGIYRRCADGHSVAVPCLKPSTDCTDRSVPSRIPGACVRWYSCCKEPPKDVDYLRSPEEKAQHRGELYQKAVTWLVAGARAIKGVWNSLLDRVRGGGEQGTGAAQYPPHAQERYVTPGSHQQGWRQGSTYSGQQSYGAYSNQRAHSKGVYGYSSGKQYSSPSGNDWVKDYKRRPYGGYQPPAGGVTPPMRDGASFDHSSFPTASSSQFPTSTSQFPSSPSSVSGFSSRRPTTPSHFTSGGAIIPDMLLPPPTDAAVERTSFGTPGPKPMTSADAIVAEAARRWLPTDCGRLSPLTGFGGTLVSRRRKRDITGGHPADRSRWAWMAIIGMRQAGENWAENRGEGPVWVCGGAVITRQFVLTAAHCVGGRAMDKLVVRLGEYNLSSTADGPHQDRLVSAVTLHPQFVSR